MTPDDIPKVGAGAATLVSAALGYLTWREGQKQRVRETTQQRIDREAAERGADLDRNEAGMRYLIATLREEVDRLKADLATLRAEMQRDQATIAEQQADLAQANITIRALTRDNERLTRRVAEMETKQAGGPA